MENMRTSHSWQPICQSVPILSPAGWQLHTGTASLQTPWAVKPC